jgi:hypothetical protein
MMRDFDYPSAFNSKDGAAILCYACHCKDMGWTPIVMRWVAGEVKV